MNIKECVEKIVSSTGNPRYRFLCGDENPDTEQREAYTKLVMRACDDISVLIRPVPSEPTPRRDNPTGIVFTPSGKAVSVTIGQINKIKNCANFYNPSGCGCAWGKCKVNRAGRSDESVSHADCLSCLDAEDSSWRAREDGS